MESLLSFFRLHRDHEPRTSKTMPHAAGILPAVLFSDWSAGKMPAALWGFMESPLGLTTVHWDLEPRPSRARRKAPINRTHSQRFARFGDARQSRSVWSGCDFSAAFPSQATIR